MKIARVPRWLIILLCLLVQYSCELQDERNSRPEELPGRIERKFTLGGAPIEVVVALSSSEVELTDYLTVTIETRFAEGIHVTPPYLSEPVYSPLLLIENPGEETFWSDNLGLMVNRWTYRFEPLASGEFSLKSFVINFRLEKEKTADLSQWSVHQIKTEPIEYRVTSVDVNELDDIRDIKGLILPPYKYTPLLITSLALLGVALLTILFFRFTGKQHHQTRESINLKNYYLETIRKLDELEKKDLLNQAQFEIFHTELSEILRDYLEDHLCLRAREQTTEEFISEIVEKNKFTDDQQQILKRFLQLADLVKFATFQPDSELSVEALQKVRLFVQHTGTGHEI